MGYNAKQLKMIVREETIMLYGIVVSVPLLHIIVFLIKFNGFGIVTLQLVEILIGIFIGLFIVMTVVSYQVYKKQVL
jgi:tetrahydromethanopterin S-methyltransferase subunit G